MNVYLRFTPFLDTEMVQVVKHHPQEENYYPKTCVANNLMIWRRKESDDDQDGVLRSFPGLFC